MGVSQNKERDLLLVEVVHEVLLGPELEGQLVRGDHVDGALLARDLLI